MKKKCKVVMLITNDKTKIQKSTITNKLFFDIGNTYNKVCEHLYLITDDEIKEGDSGYFLSYDFDEPLVVKVDNATEVDLLHIHKKIIASTDFQLITNREDIGKNYPIIVNVYNGLPQFSEDFIKAYIKAYNEGNPIEEVLVEYDSIEKHERVLNEDEEICDKFSEELQLREDNTVIISQIKATYSREEVESLMLRMAEYWSIYDSDEEKQKIEKWIKKNL